MMARKSVSVFFPVYNGESVLRYTVLTTVEKLRSLGRDFDIFIVDDTSNDETPNIGKELSKNPKIHYLRFSNGPSRRENLALSFKKSKKDIVMFMDVDLSTDIRHVPEMLEWIERGYAIAIGSRYTGIRSDRGIARWTISRFYNYFLQLSFGSKIKDHQCGFKAFDRKILLHLLEKMGYDKAMERGWFWDAELLIRAQRESLRIKEIPVRWKHNEKSTFDIVREVQMIPYVVALRSRI